MKRLFIFVAGFILIPFVLASADWTAPIQVNDLTDGIQATRDSDTPWSMAADTSGNVHIVFESQDDDSLPRQTI